MNKAYVERRDEGYWIVNTRVSLDTIVYAFLDGQSPESIAQSLPVLTLEQIYGSIAFYLAHQPEVETYLERAKTDFETKRKASRESDPVFYQKLADTRVVLEQFANEYDMSKNSDDSEKVSWWTNGWEIFGKFMAIVTCTGVIVTIYINLSPSGPDLVGYGWHTSLYYPPQFKAAHDSLKNVTTSHYLYDFIEERDSTISQDSLQRIVSELSDSIQAIFEEDFVYYRGYVVIKIRNEGDRVASDIVLDIPRRGIALITHPDTVQYVTRVDRNVSLNNLRPGNIVEVQIWTERHIFTSDEGTLQITYDRGVGSISFSKEFSGMWRIYR